MIRSAHVLVLALATALLPGRYAAFAQEAAATTTEPVNADQAPGTALTTQPSVAAAGPVAEAQSSLLQLDQLRAVEANDPPRVLELLKRGTDAIALAKKRVGEELPPAAPSTAPAGRARRSDADQKAAAAQRRLALCQLAFMQAELHRRAALALPGDHPERAKNLEHSLAGSKALRIEYRDLVAARLGYAGEARVHRARGDLAQAEGVLAHVAIELDERRLTRESPSVLQVQRVLWLERAETALAKSASAPIVGDLERSSLITGASPPEQAALKWVKAQAAANAALAANDGDANAAAQQLRDAAITDAAPEHQRLALLVKLAQHRGVALAAAERLQWARLQAWAGLTDAAIATYEAAAKAHPSDIAPADWLAYGSLMHGAGKVDAAADALAKGFESIPADAAQRVAVLRAIAAGRVQAAKQKPADADARKLATDALWRLAESAQDVSTRRDALRSWAHFQQQSGTFDQHLAAVDRFKDDVASDPYLYLLVANARWRAGAAATQPSSASLAGEITSNLTRLLPDADPELAPSLVLLMGQIAAAAPGGARAALDIVGQHQALIKADAPATPQLLALKLRLLMDLGLTGEAEALANQLQSGAVNTTTGLKLADMLADRYAGGDTPPNAREQIVAMVSRSLAQHAEDARYRDSALSAATTLLKVKAYADAQQILEGLRSTGTPIEKDPPIALLFAAAMQGQGRVEDAQKILAAVARENPKAGEVHLATARLQHELQQWAPAAAAYRLARKELRAGGNDWWQATVGLGECLTQQGNAAGAAELLRVANAMYRSRAPASLLPRIDTLLKQPVSSVETRNGRNG